MIKQTEAKWYGVINQYNYNFNHFSMLSKVIFNHHTFIVSIFSEGKHFPDFSYTNDAF